MSRKDACIKMAGCGWTEEYRKAQSERLKVSWTEEMKKVASERCKKLYQIGVMKPPNRKGAKHSEASKKYMSEKMKELMTDERRKVLSEKTKAYWTPERRKQESKREKAEYGKMRSVILKQRWRNPEFREKMVQKLRENSQKPEFKEKISNTTKQRWEDSEFREKMSNMSKQMWEDPEYVKKMYVFSDTKPERILQQALKKVGASFVTQKPLIGIPDIFIEPNICIFVDGDYWHNRAEAIERDKYVNEELKNRGYAVLRFWEHEIYENLERVVNEIL